MKASDVLSRDEIRELTRPSDLRGWEAVSVTWMLVAGAFALVGAWPSVWSVSVALIVLGGRQLALAVLMHEASHHSLFATRWLNDVVGTICAAPVWTDVFRYRAHHLAHHVHTGTDGDPDLDLVRPFPTSRAALARKLVRDLIGLTAIRRVAAQVLMDAELVSYSASLGQRWQGRQGRSLARIAAAAARHTGPVLIANAALFGVLAALGQGWLYALWIGAHLTTYNVFLRLRAMAEHACMDLSDDPLRNTRTTRAGWLARLTVAPLHVNLHLEHHLLMTAPWWQLPRLHRLLRERGVLTPQNTAGGYRDVLRRMVRT